MSVQAGGRTFDWVSWHDPESRGYPVRSLVPATPAKTVWWAGGYVLDQGEEGTCAPHAVVGEYLASPVRGKVASAAAGHQLAVEMFPEAQKIDGLPDELGGTTTNAVMKIGRARGWWDSYHWAFGIDDVRKALVLGPVVLGINWYESMYETKRGGEVVVDGPLVGGHCLLLTGWSPSYGNLGEVFRWRNSWGLGYGKGGNGYVRVADLARLLSEDGEAAVPTGRHLVANPR